MGESPTWNSGHNWWMAESASAVALSGTHFFFWGYYATDARRGASLSNSG